MSNFLHYGGVALVFILIIAVLVGIHELGHYLFARFFGAGVEEFAIGIGRPKLLTWLRRKNKMPDGSELETEFTIRAWPIGGFVRILGMEIRDDGSETRIPGGFYTLAPWKRFATLLAGPTFSVLLGLVILSPLYAARGVLRETPVVAMIAPNSAAANAGIQVGDRLVKVNGEPVNDGFSVRRLVRGQTQGPIALEVVRKGEAVKLSATPIVDPEPQPILGERLTPTGEEARQARLGLAFTPARVPASPGKAAGEAFATVYDSAAGVIRTFANPRQAKDNVGGVISVAVGTDAVVSDSLELTLQWAALLSISIGLFNLLPIPPLDGGQMMIALIEMIRGGRRLSLRTQLAFMNGGALLLLLLISSVLVLDVTRFFGPRPAAPVSRPAVK